MKNKLIYIITTALLSSLAYNSLAQDNIDRYFTFRGWKGDVSLKITMDTTSKNEYDKPRTVKYIYHAVGIVDIMDEEYDNNEGRAGGIWPRYDMMKQIMDPQIVMRWEPKVTYSNSVTEFGRTYTCTYAGVNPNPDFPQRGTVQIMLFGEDQYRITISGSSFMEKCDGSDALKTASSALGYYGEFLKLPKSGNVISGKQKIEKDGYVIEAEWNLTGYK